MSEGIKSILKLNKYLFLGNKWLYITHGLMSLLWCFAPFMLAFLVNLLLDDLSAGHMQRYVIVLMVYMVLTYVNIHYARKSGIVEAKITSYVEKTLQLSTLRRVLQEKEERCNDVGMMVDILENDYTTLETMLLVQMEFLCNVISFFGSFVIVLKINVYLTFFGFLPVAVLSAFVGYFGEKLKERFMNARESNIDFSVLTTEIVEKHEIFQYIADRESVLEVFRRKCVLRGDNKLKKSRYTFWINHSMTLLSNISVLLILILVAVIPGKASVSVGTMTLFVNSIHNGFSFLQLYNNIVMVLKVTESSMERICALLGLTWKEMPECLSGRRMEEIDKSPLFDGDLGLTFSNFRMSMSDVEHDFQLNPGEIMVVSGGNSSGKSYFINCIAGYRTYNGKIEVSNKKRIRTGYLSQDATLFHASLKENVTLFDSSENAEKALIVSNFMNNSRNWDVMSNESIGVNGKRLSEGQRQRIAIARAVLNGKNILLLDDPFLFLDKENRKVILKNIKALNKTAVIVSNDENVIREADIHLVIENGRIQEINRNKAF